MKDIFLKIFGENDNPFMSLGVFLTFITSILSLIISIRGTRATHYIDAITKSRVEWMDKLRKLVSNYIQCAYVNSNTDTTTLEGSQGYNQLLQLSSEITLMLNFKGKYDKEIIDIIQEINSNYELLSDAYQCLEDYGEELRENILNEEIVHNDYFQKNLFEFANKKGITVHPRDEYVDDNDKIVDLFLKVITTNEEREEFMGCLFIRPGHIVNAIQDKINYLTNLMQVYLKSEWNRVKKEAEGKKYSTKNQEKELALLFSDYDNDKNK